MAFGKYQTDFAKRLAACKFFDQFFLFSRDIYSGQLRNKCRPTPVFYYPPQRFNGVATVNQIVPGLGLRIYLTNRIHLVLKTIPFFQIPNICFSNFINFHRILVEKRVCFGNVSKKLLEGQPLHTFGDYLKTAALKEVANVSNGIEAVETVLRNNEFLLESFKEILGVASEKGDEGTAGMMNEWIGGTEKRIWMLKSFLA